VKLQVVLYNPQSSAARKRIVPFSLLALGAVLEGRHAYDVVDGNCEDDPQGALRALVSAGANVLAVTAMPGPQLADAVAHCRTLKAEHPSLTIVWGGYFATQHAEVCLRAPYIDFVVRGHGEAVFMGLLEALASGADPRGLPGLAYRSAAGAFVQNPLPPIPHPEQLPPFPYDRFDMPRYVRPTFLGKRTLSHHSSYGCPFLCNFCAVVNMVQGRWLAQSPDRVAGIVRKYVEEWSVDAVEFYDNNFFTHEARTAEIAERILPLRVAWWGEGRIDTLLNYSDATWALIRRSGLRMVFMGAEAASAEALARMDKGGTLRPEMAVELAARMKSIGVVPEFSFVLGSPPEPESDVAQSLALVRRIKEANAASEIILYNYTPVPLAGELYDSARASGFRFAETLEEWTSPAWQDTLQRRSEHLPWLGGRLRRRIRNFERVLNAYYPTTTDARLSGLRRAILRGSSTWRYRWGVYGFPVELRALQRLFRYQRPETTGF
jgi:radical SAM superfamily enzyme YgiQ (UPF0313 family)